MKNHPHTGPLLAGCLSCQSLGIKQSYFSVWLLGKNVCPPETLLTGQEQGPSWEERREVIGMEEILASTLAPASNIVHQGLPANKIETLFTRCI